MIGLLSLMLRYMSDLYLTDRSIYHHVQHLADLYTIIIISLILWTFIHHPLINNSSFHVTGY